jgi:hypothetical protein
MERIIPYEAASFVARFEAESFGNRLRKRPHEGKIFVRRPAMQAAHKKSAGIVFSNSLYFWCADLILSLRAR